MTRFSSGAIREPGGEILSIESRTPSSKISNISALGFNWLSRLRSRRYCRRMTLCKHAPCSKQRDYGSLQPCPVLTPRECEQLALGSAEKTVGKLHAQWPACKREHDVCQHQTGRKADIHDKPARNQTRLRQAGWLGCDIRACWPDLATWSTRYHPFRGDRPWGASYPTSLNNALISALGF
jgi:hypothetical protein